MLKPYNKAYHTQKSLAKRRNLDWQFTYDTWIEWWGTDIVNRGHKRGQLVMARYGDIGPYHPDNVRKATCSENCKEGNIGRPSPLKGTVMSAETRAKISNTKALNRQEKETA